MEHLWDPLLEVVELANEVCKVNFVLGLWVFKELIVKGADEEKDLAPLNMARVSDLLHRCLALLVFQLLGDV